jgi:hypothetical protein
VPALGVCERPTLWAFSRQPSKLCRFAVDEDINPDSLARYVAELYVEKMAIKLPKV